MKVMRPLAIVVSDRLRTVAIDIVRADEARVSLVVESGEDFYVLVVAVRSVESDRIANLRVLEIGVMPAIGAQIAEEFLDAIAMLGTIDLSCLLQAGRNEIGAIDVRWYAFMHGYFAARRKLVGTLMEMLFGNGCRIAAACWRCCFYVSCFLRIG